MNNKRPRFPAIKQRPDGSKGCRGCGGEIPKGRLTWCSHACHLKYDPFYVKQAVRKRSEEKCENPTCGKDCSRKAQQSHAIKMPKPPSYTDCGCSWPFDSTDYYASSMYEKYIELLSEWRKLEVKPEYDHIIPHSEGGEFVVENIRLLCRACHLARTAAWRKERAERQRSHAA